MPTFSVEDGRQFVAYVTGPSHIRLGLLLTTAPVEEPLIIERPAIGQCAHGEIDRAQLVRAVRAGIASISAAINAAEIVFITNDSPHYSLFSRCAALLTERFLEQPDGSPKNS